MPTLMDNILLMAGIIDYEYKKPVAPTVLYFDKTLWNNYWQAVADDLNLITQAINQITGEQWNVPNKPDDSNKPKPNKPNTMPAPFDCYISAIDSDKALYQSNDRVSLTITFANSDISVQKGHYTVSINTPTGSVLNVADSSFDLNSGYTKVQTVFDLPVDNNVGYLITVTLRDSNNNIKSQKTSALDVSDTWTTVPRYGVLTNFDSNNQENADGLVNSISLLNKYHINATMYYDAYFRPQNTIPSSNYQTWIGRKVDRAILQQGVQLNHQYGQSAMLYNMINATTGTPDDNDTAMSNSDLFGSTITRQDGTKGIASKMGVYRTGKCNERPVPGTFDGLGEQATYNMLGSFNDRDDVDHKVQYYYNPASPDWQKYIGNIMQSSLNLIGFDGWQGDTIGDIYGVPYEDRGTNNNGFHTIDTYASFINAVKPAYFADKTLGMNAVNYGGQDKLNSSKADFNYSELWQSDKPTYQDLADCIKETNSVSDKPLIVPAYMYHDWFDNNSNDLPSHFKDESILIKDAIIFANGGSPMELANGKELPTEYYPDVEKNRIIMSDNLGDPDNGLLRKMYDFVTAYSNLIYRSKFNNQEVVVNANGSQINSDTADCGKINTITKQTRNIDVLQMINLTSVSSDNWQINNADDEKTKNIKPLTSLDVKWYTEKNGTLYSTSFENDSIRQKINYQSGNDSQGNYIEFIVDNLNLWNMYYID